ncbi:MAG TPA: tRNA lysidine(34) synthetase TilS [Sulfuricurvum sp.]|nr:tRNA lysidine(34) synthetase TilS [Sulfuricurvum sp.]
MRKLLHLEQLREGKVLLAFSGGVDSTALFHILLENNIAFDIAHVNYHTRAASETEALNAQTLAHSYNLQCHSHSCRLDSINFEHRAREERYAFFETLMEKYRYTYLLTAHQLNDRLEWMLMQLTRGCGLPELLGIKSQDTRGKLSILRPLLQHNRQEIEAYLNRHNLSHFIDESNSDESYTRNRFRHRHSTPIMREHSDAIRRSFRYLDEDSDLLIEKVLFESVQELYYATNPSSTRSLIYGIDQHLKSLGILMSGHEKERLKKEKSCVISRQYVVSMEENRTFIAPYYPKIVMDKGFKEECRKLKIDPKLRGYLYGAHEAFALIRRLKEPLKPLQCD